MNINLGPTPEPNFGETMESMQDEIEEHQEILRSAGFSIVGPAALLPESSEYPGSYQVWSPCFSEGTQKYGWVYIDPDGNAIIEDRLSTAEEMMGA